MSALDYLWRLIGTGLSFSVFGIGSLILGIFVVPLIMVVARDREQQLEWSRVAVGAAMKGFALFMSAVGVLRYEITGINHIKDNEAYLIVANHPSLIDVVFLLSVFPDADCVIKEQLRRNIFTRNLMRGVGYISNDNPVEWLQKCVERLENGHSLILFPEGTRTVPGETLAFKAGAAAVAARSGAKCLPVVISVEPTTLTKAESWYQIPSRRVYFSMAIQPPISVSETLGQGANARDAGRSFNNYLAEYFELKLQRQL